MASYPVQLCELDNGVKLAYRLARPLDQSKETIVLFHSFLMDSRLYLPQFEDDSFAAFNLVAVDEHGHGYTEGPEDFTFWDSARDGLALMKELGVPRFYILGTSQGGFIAMRMALLASESTDPAAQTAVKGLILLGTNAASESDENKQLFKQVRDFWCSTDIPTEDAMRTKTGSFGGPEVVGEETYRQICENWRRRHSGSRGYDPAMRCLSGRDSIVDRLGEIKVPVLVMHGTADTIYSVAGAQQWAKKLPNVWSFKVVDGGFHYLSFTSPGTEACAEYIPLFIKSTL
ncbi:Alpha/Beta hydrolase protein [Protomyces lactucae-debilis]|uniref:Alpha/Beta hydrolase protein n=1 Tax=Protomyces lactucae-debilis TaxID=2754530 RepID=A0A1Y2EZT1_PROLT|nr:Alpha/Beta hydrolase protein [Protomyces lactucae-debilis]ORY76626.1 Alpha/Beta hydrolase protein [Protomyces lactucae-debilis]